MKNLLDKLFRDSADPNDGTWDLVRMAFAGLRRRPRDTRGLKLGGLENRLLYSATPVSPEMLLPDKDAGVDADCAVAVEIRDDSPSDKTETDRNNCWDMGSDSGDVTDRYAAEVLADRSPDEPQVALPGAGLLSRDAAQFLIPDERADPANATTSTLDGKTSHELALVDTSADDYQQLLDDLWSNRDPDRNIDVVLLDSRQDGVQQITGILSRYEDLDAIHIVSHGTEGGVRLGSTWLDAKNMAAYAADVAGWQEALAADADLLFYGCNLARSESGRTLVDSLSALTGADVTASSDNTGHALLGGDWELEYATGAIEIGVAFSGEAQQYWMGLLAAPDATDDPGTLDSTLTAMNPAGYWRLGESTGATAVDETANANDGTYGGPLLAQAGALAGDADTAATFDGVDDYVEVGHDASYLIDNGTIQFWFNAQDTTAGHLFSKDAFGFVDGGHLSAYLNPSGRLEVRLQSATASYFVQSTPAQPIAAGQWHHMAFTFGSDGMKLYVDGQLAATNAYTGGLGTTSGGSGNTEPIVFGASTQTSGTGSVDPLKDFFHGTIDEVALLGTALTEEQVQDLYAAGIQNYSLNANATFSVTSAAGVLANDFDADGDALTARNLDTTTTQGRVTLNPDGSFQYDPYGQFDYLGTGQTAVDTFNYTAYDGVVDSNSATVSVSVTGTNDAPQIADWYDDAWLYRKEITIDATQVAANLTDFPALINLSSDPDLAALAQSDGDDILFTRADGTTRLSHEIDRYQTGAGGLSAWVKTDLSASQDTRLYLYFGNASAADQQNAAGVWDAGYQGVWHLNQAPNGAAGEIVDSTIHDNDGTTEGGMTAADLVDARIGKGLDFDEIDDLVRVADSTSLDGTSDAATIEAWAWFDDSADGVHQIIMTSSNRFTPGAKDGYEWASQGDGDHFFYPYGGTDPNYNLGPDPFTSQTWHHVAVTLDFAAKDVAILVDGNPMAFTEEHVPTTWTTLADPADWLWGGNPDRPTRYFDGVLDELRVSDTVRSQQWIQTSVNNQTAPDTFHALGNLENRDATLTDINEDTSSPVGDTVAQIIASTGGDRITDADSGALEGIAVVGTDNTHGTWQYSLDGGANWNSFGSVSDSSAVLLDTAARVRFVPGADYHGPSGNVSYRAWDRTSGLTGDTGVDTTTHGGTSAFSETVNSAHLNVLSVNDNPVASGDTLTTNEDTPLVISAASLLANDADVDLDTLTISSATQPTHGTLVNNGNGTYTYTPAANYEGSDAFTYTVSDGNGGTDTAAVNITVQGLNDAPLNLVPGAQLTDEDTPLVFSTPNGNRISVFDIDAKGSEMEVTLSAVNGAVSLGGTTGLTFSAGDGTADSLMTFRGTVSDLNSALNGLQFLPAADYSGPATLQITTTDLGNSGAGGPETDVDVIPVTINPVNDRPVATGDELSTGQDTPLVISVASLLANDTDVDFDTLALAGFSPPTHGTLVDNGNGTLTYTPHSGFSGVDAFSYTATDGQAPSAPTLVTINVRKPSLSGAIPPETGGDGSPADDLPGTESPNREPASEPPPAGEPTETPRGDERRGEAIVRGRFQRGVEFSPILPAVYQVERASSMEAIEETTFDYATASLDSVAMSRAARDPGRSAEQHDAFSIDVHLLWEQLDAFRNEVAWDTGYYAVGAAAATGTFAVLSAGYAAWTVRGGYLLSSVLTALPAWRLMDPLPVLATSASVAPAKPQTSRETDETLQSLTSGQPLASASDMTAC